MRPHDSQMYLFLICIGCVVAAVLLYWWTWATRQYGGSILRTSIYVASSHVLGVGSVASASFVGRRLIGKLVAHDENVVDISTEYVMLHVIICIVAAWLFGHWLLAREMSRTRRVKVEVGQAVPGTNGDTALH